MRGLAGIFAFALASCLPTLASAQTQSLIADSLTIDANVLRAEGNVTVYLDKSRVTASKVTYDQRTERIGLVGPITVHNSDGSIILAEQANLSRTQNRDILRTARALFNDRLQVSAGAAVRNGPRTAFYDTAMTSCQICAGQSPLWEIRSDRVIRDAQAERNWVRNATFAIKGVPVFWLPSISFPAAGVKRARGFLRPRLSFASAQGATANIPYFIPIGDHRDLLVTPIIGEQTVGSKLRYRRAFSNGNFNINATTLNKISGEEIYGAWVRADGAFSFGDHWRVSGDLEAISDPGFLDDFDISDQELLDSAIHLERVTPRMIYLADLSHYQLLRTSTAAKDEPRWWGRALHERRRPLAGGILTAGVTFDGYRRRLIIARAGSFDQMRVGAKAFWDKRAILSGGFEVEASAGIRTNYFTDRRLSGADFINDDGVRTQVFGQTGISLPLKRSRGEITDIVTPRATISWRDYHGFQPGNGDSQDIIVDEALLHSFDLVSGQGRDARGTHLGLSLAWNRSAGTTQTWLRAGRLYQTDPVGNTRLSGLASNWSDWVVQAGTTRNRLSLQTSLGLGDDDLTRAHTTIDYRFDRANLSLTHAYVASDPANFRWRDLSVLYANGGWRATDTLSLRGTTSYDIDLAEPRDFTVGVDWWNECLRVSLSASHSFESSVTNEAKTNYGFDVTIEGFSANQGPISARTCNK